MTPDLEPPKCLNAAFFEHLYRLSEDPWEFRSSSYEQAKYNITLAALSREHYAHAFEPGCSVGELTRCSRRAAGTWSPPTFRPPPSCAHVRAVRPFGTSKLSARTFGPWSLGDRSI